MVLTVARDIHQQPMEQRRQRRPPSKKRKTKSLGTAPADDLQESDSDDYGNGPWDPHAGMKPSPLAGDASDGEWELEESGFGSMALYTAMVKMLSELEGVDPHDLDWLPKLEQRKMDAKKSQFGATPRLVLLLT